MKKFLLGATAFVAMFAGPAMAADMPVKAPVLKAPPPPAFSWNGCYIGAAGGGVWGRSRHDGFPPGPTELTPFFTVSGGLIGAEYGCNYQFGGNWVFGTESDFSWTSKKGNANDTGPGGVPTFVSTTKEQWLSTSRVRVGPSFDRTWVYATGGFALARVEADLNTNIAGLPLFQDRHTEHGWTAGAGVEQSLGNNWSIKGEYLYVRLHNKAFLFGNNPIVGPNGLNAQRAGVNLDDHVFRVGLNYKFIDCLLICAPAPVAAKY